MNRLFFVFALFFVLLSCKKEQDDWAWCVNCTVDDLVGTYEGLADYEQMIQEISQIDQKAYMQISKWSDNGIRILTGIEGRTAYNLSGAHKNDYYISVGSVTQSFSGNIYKNQQGQIRIQGTARKGQLRYDAQTERDTLILHETISLDMYKVVGE